MEKVELCLEIVTNSTPNMKFGRVFPYFASYPVFGVLPLLVLSRAKAKVFSSVKRTGFQSISSSCISKSLLNLGRGELVLLLDDEIF